MSAELDLAQLVHRRREAMLASDEGRLPEAEAQLDALVDELGGAVSGRSGAELAQTLVDRAFVRETCNRPADALSDFDEAAVVADGLAMLPRRMTLALVLGQRAGLLARVGAVQDLDRAHLDLQRARELGYARNVADEFACQIAAQRGDWRTVVEISESLITTSGQQPYPVGMAFTRLRAGEAWLELGELDRAEAELDYARSFLERLGPPDRLARALLLAGRLHALRSEHEIAHALVSRALSQLETLIRRFRSLDAQQRFVTDKLAFYAHAFDIALAAGGEAALWRAWSIAERAKSFYLCQLMANADVGLLDGVSPALAEQFAAVERRLEALDAQLATGGETERREQTVVERSRVDAEYNALLGVAMQSNPRWASARAPSPVDVREAVGSLPDGWSALSHFWRESGDEPVLHVFHASAGRPPTHAAVAWSTQQLEQLQAHVEKLAIADEHDLFFAASFPAGCSELIMPSAIASLLAPDEPLVISSHGVLAATALPALAVGSGQRLIERCPVLMTPSLALLALSRPQTTRASVLLMGCEQDGFGHRRLQDAPAEIRALAARWTAAGRTVSTALLPPDGTLESAGHALDGWGKHGIVHIACHGEFDVDDPLNAALLLGSDRVRAKEFFTVGLDAELVVLSACDLGQREEQASSERGFDEWVGFQIPLLYAGAQMILASRWKANSASAARFMTALHDALAGGQPVVRAVQTASLALMRPAETFWAGWALVGVPPAKPMTPEES